jgi:hypothetical protein
MTCEVAGNSLLPDLAGTRIQLRGKAVALEPDDAEVIARYPGGEAAITCADRGKGRCLYFAFSVFPDNKYGRRWDWLAEDVVLDKGWRSLFRALCGELGIRTGRDIWRFRYPAPEAEPAPALACLTGNAVRWECEQPHFDENRPVAGSYSYSVAPDLIADVGGANIPFADGNLTDRRDAATPGADPAVEPYVVAWQTTAPVGITFDLVEPTELAAVRLFSSGRRPATAVRVSTDGQDWVDGPSAEAFDAGEDVIRLELQPPKGAFRYVHLDLAERPPETTFTLCEVDIWAAK